MSEFSTIRGSLIQVVPCHEPIHIVENPEKFTVPTQGKASLIYLVAALQRSGSNLLVRQLLRAGVGYPAEYFQPNIARSFSALSNLPNFKDRDYLKFVLSVRQSQFGIFGVKSHWEQFEPLTEEVRGFFGNRGKFLLTVRRDLAKQAVSYERALQTGRWDPRWQVNEESRMASADPEDLGKLLDRCRDIAELERKWLEYFQQHGAKPHLVFYEDLLGDHDREMRRIFDYLGVDAKVPPKEPAPKGKTGEIGRDMEILSELREELARNPIVRFEF